MGVHWGFIGGSWGTGFMGVDGGSGRLIGVDMNRAC